MRTISKIARAELRSLFYSPIAWLVFVVFFLVSGIGFVMQLSMLTAMQEHIQQIEPGWLNWEKSLTAKMFGGVFEVVMDYLYIFIPLLTMGVINREVNSGSIRLLYSSPVKVHEIVLGKFMGLMIYIALLVGSIAVVMVTGYIAIDHADYGVFFTALLGFFLLGCAFTAIGIFISCLTNYQIVAGVVTFLFFLALHLIGGLWQQYDFVRDLTYFLSMNGRIDNLVNGLLTSKDVLYFLLIIGLFLSFSIIKLRSIRESSDWLMPAARYATVLVVTLLIGYGSSRPGYIAYLDVTRNQVNTIHPATQQVLAELGDEPLTVTLYTNLFDNLSTHGFPQNRNKYVWNFWDRYRRFHPNIELNYVYYYDVMDSLHFAKQYPNKSITQVAEELMIAKKLPKANFKTPEEIRSLIDLSGEEKRLVMQLEYKGKKTFLRTFPRPSPWPQEMHVSAAIRRLVARRIPSIVFTTGHYERSPFKFGERQYASGTVRKESEIALINTAACTIDSIRLDERELPRNLDLLVVADPRSAFSQNEQLKIIRYLEQGGNALFFCEPGKQSILNPLLSTIGVQLQPGTIVHPNPQEMPHILTPDITPAGFHLANERFLYLMQTDSTKKYKVRMIGAASIAYNPGSAFTVQPVFTIEGDDTKWIESGKLVVDSAAPVFSAAEGDLQLNRYVTGIALSGIVNQKEQRIVVTGDADFMSDFRGIGGAFGTAAYSWALYNEYPKYTNKPPDKDVLFTIGPSVARTIQMGYLYVAPLMILALGAVILVRRNRK